MLYQLDFEYICVGKYWNYHDTFIFPTLANELMIRETNIDVFFSKIITEWHMYTIYHAPDTH